MAGSLPTAEISVVSELAQTRVQITTRTLRVDRWWLQPVLTQFGLLAFVVYSTWVAFQNDHYYSGPYSRRSTRHASLTTVRAERRPSTPPSRCLPPYRRR